MIKYIPRIISVTSGDKRPTNLECFKSRLPSALRLIVMFIITGLIGGTISIYGMLYLAGAPLVSWNIIPMLGIISGVLGVLASLGIFVEPIPPTEEEIHTHNEAIYKELRQIYEKV